MTLSQSLRRSGRRLSVYCRPHHRQRRLGPGLLVMRVPLYAAHASGYIGVAVPESANGSTDFNSHYNAPQRPVQKAKAIPRCSTSQTMTSRARQQPGLSEKCSELASRISAAISANSITAGVTATASSSNMAERITDSVVNQSATRVRRLKGTGAPVSIVMMPSVSLSEIDAALAPLK
ncbi:Hypothetical protein PFR_JS13-1_1467 [Propionibacterium freudenreichii]|nr:Hypothetical protein PFR_JS11_1467 [Propionibacterium freudenreichii]SCQ49038.1 Hypothetical protein PFR_JS13-1_1467 [Propionibacterium freudenreichii]